MAKLVKVDQQNNESAKLYFQETTEEEIAKKLNKRLVDQGYKIKTGDQLKGEYEKGNRVLRILFGLFVKYFKFRVSIEEEDGLVYLTMYKTTSGFSGGLIGVSLAKKEMGNLIDMAKKIK